MNLVKPYARMLPPVGVKIDQRFLPTDGIELLERVEFFARISHRSEDAPPTTDRFIRSVVLQHGDWSVTEHASVSCDFYVDRGITHELVRHRLFAFTQESTRFVNYIKKMPPSFIMPDQLALSDVNPVTGSIHWTNAIEAAERAYRGLLEEGYQPQIARSVFPNALASRIVITGNLRNWRHFFLMRTTRESHPQMREVTIPLLKEFQEKISILYEDIEPDARQIDNLKKGR